MNFYSFMKRVFSSSQLGFIISLVNTTSCFCQVSLKSLIKYANRWLSDVQNDSLLHGSLSVNPPEEFWQMVSTSWNRMRMFQVLVMASLQHVHFKGSPWKSWCFCTWEVLFLPVTSMSWRMFGNTRVIMSLCFKPSSETLQWFESNTLTLTHARSDILAPSWPGIT